MAQNPVGLMIKIVCSYFVSSIRACTTFISFFFNFNIFSYAMPLQPDNVHCTIYNVKSWHAFLLPKTIQPENGTRAMLSFAFRCILTRKLCCVAVLNIGGLILWAFYWRFQMVILFRCCEQIQLSSQVCNENLMLEMFHAL